MLSFFVVASYFSYLYFVYDFMMMTMVMIVVVIIIIYTVVMSPISGRSGLTVFL